jgi:hypothetical protein
MTIFIFVSLQLTLFMKLIYLLQGEIINLFCILNQEILTSMVEIPIIDAKYDNGIMK